MTGKNKCKILKDIRRQIAEKNDIDLVIKDCTFQGECKGTCPRCESEVRYLENELKKRISLGKTIAVAGIVSLLAATTSSCANQYENIPKTPSAESPDTAEHTEITDGLIELMGEPVPETEPIQENIISFSELLSSDKEQALNYMQKFNREEIQTEWAGSIVSTSVTTEKYRINTGNGEYYVTIEYDTKGKPIALSVTQVYTSTLATETGELVLTGDVVYIPEGN